MNPWIILSTESMHLFVFGQYIIKNVSWVSLNPWIRVLIESMDYIKYWKHAPFCFLPRHNQKCVVGVIKSMDKSRFWKHASMRAFYYKRFWHFFRFLKMKIILKNQLISKANFKVFIWTKKWTKIFLYFCPSLEKEVRSK